MATAACKHKVINVIERECVSLPTSACKICENGLILRFSKTFWNNATYHSNRRNSNFYEIWCQLHATLTQKVYFSRSCKFIAGKDERMHSAVCPAVNYSKQPILRGWQIKRVTRCDSRPLRTPKRIEVSAAIIKILFLFQIMAMAAYKHNVKNIIERKCISLPTRAYKIYENGLILRFSKTFWNNASNHNIARNSNFYE